MLAYKENPVGIEVFYRVATLTVEQIFFVRARGNSKITRLEPRLSVLYKFEMLAAWPRHAFTGLLTDSRLTRWSHYVTKNKPHANGHNIVGEQLPVLLLHVVGSCFTKFETSQTFEPTTPNNSYYKVLWVVSAPRCTEGPNSPFGRCCITLHTTANMDTTTPNIADPTTFGIVASVCS